MRIFNYKNLINSNRKILYVILTSVLISVFSLTIVYAALSVTLNIQGNAEVSSSSWDIHLDNVKLNSKSATTSLPTIKDNITATFSTTLNMPGDFYEFTIDVVNNGSIDAMIDGVSKTPTLTETQAKYLNYVVEYQNGESINTKQLVAKNSFVRLKVRVEFRKDITASDLPTTSETLNLAFTVNYIQSDGTGSDVTDNGVKKALSIISGNIDTIGSELAIEDEIFYIISSTDEKITMISKYNLYVGGEYESSWEEYGTEATGIQNSEMLAWLSTQTVRKGTTAFSFTNYWSSSASGYPTYVYNSDAIIYDYVENYKIYLENKGIPIEEARLINIIELESLGCSRSSGSCTSGPKWIYETSYWTGSASGKSSLYRVGSTGLLLDSQYSSNAYYGVRPVITISKTLF